MKFLKSLFNKRTPIENVNASKNSNEIFWEWFLNNHKRFYNVIKNKKDIHKLFFEKLSPKLNEVKDGIWFLAGMFDDNTAELILTADGDLKNIAFIEELVASAPLINNWKVTALKQPSEGDSFNIEMDGFEFNDEKMSFYAIEHNGRPDEIDIVITHKDFSEENKKSIINGVYIALDNFLGELNSVSLIDNLEVINPKDAKQDLKPYNKLKSYIIWREKEFLERYEGVRHNSENDIYSSLEATLNNNLPLLAVVNSTLLDWEDKASHQWILRVEIPYEGANNNGMPNSDDYQKMNEVEDEITALLVEAEGYLNIGRQTADSMREIYFACIDFREPSKVLPDIQNKYLNDFEIDFYIYKDKYWVSLDRYRAS